MKFTKMSLVAALLVGSSAFAIENTKVSGDAKLFYSTNDDTNQLVPTGVAGSKASLFNKDSSAGQAAVSLGLTTDLVTGVSAGVKGTVLTTLGLQGQLVNNVWEATNGVSDSYIVNEAWMATTLGKTTAKIGRMELDTPLVFSEKWSIVANTFEAAVVINQDVPDTVLVGAYVGGSNGAHNTNAATIAGGGIGNILAGQGNNDTTFSQFHRGAYAVAAINNSFKPLTVQAWYFQASHVLKSAIWLQADLACQKVPGLMVGLQYSTMDLSSLAPALKSNDVMAAMVGYEMKDLMTAKLSYSVVSNDAGAGAGFNLSGGAAPQSKLYTEAWWNYGNVTKVDTKTMNLTVEAPVADVADFGLYVTAFDKPGIKTDATEVTITASKSVGPLDATLAAIYYDDDAVADTTMTVQAYLTLNF